MFNLNKINYPGLGHFISGNTFRRINLFGYNPIFCKYFIDNLYFYKRKYNFEFSIFTIIPEHYHAIIFPQENTKIQDILMNLKGYTAWQIIKYLKNNSNKEFTIAYRQKIVSPDFFQKLLKITSNKYYKFSKKRFIDPKIHQYHYLAYLIDLGLLIPNNQLFLPKIITLTKLRNKIKKIIPEQNNYRKIILRVKGKELLALMQLNSKTTDQAYKVFQHQDYDTVIETEKIYNIKVNYILNNAVKRGLTKVAENYKWLIINDELIQF